MLKSFLYSTVLLIKSNMLLTRQKVVDESSEGIVCYPNRVVNHFASKLLLIVLFLLRRTTSLLLLAHLVEKNKAAVTTLQGDQDHFFSKEMLITPSILKLHKNP